MADTNKDSNGTTVAAMGKEDLLKDLVDKSWEQLSVIKANETSWLQYFLVFYGAIILLVTTQNVEFAKEPLALVFLMIAVVCATLLFAYHFLRLRFGYYDVKANLTRYQIKLGMFDADGWPDGEAPLLDWQRFPGGPDGKPPWHHWWSETAPLKDFLLRVVMLFGSNLLSMLALRFEYGSSTGDLLEDWLVLTSIIVGNALGVVVVYGVDFSFFRRKWGGHWISKEVNAEAGSVRKGTRG